MLYIENIDDNSIRFGSGVGGGTYFKVLPKTLLARKDESDRIWIEHTQNNESVMNSYLVADINLDGTVYGTAEEFVVAFNILVNAGGSGGGSGSTTAAPGSSSYDTPGIGTLTNGNIVLAAGTLHSLTITCTSGNATVTIDGVPVSIDIGQSMSWGATDLLDSSVTIDTTGSPSDSVDYNFIGVSATTTTTTLPVTTTTTTI